MCSRWQRTCLHASDAQATSSPWKPGTLFPHHQPTSARLHLQDRTDMAAQVGDSWRVRGPKFRHLSGMSCLALFPGPLDDLCFGRYFTPHKPWRSTQCCILYTTRVFCSDAETTRLEMFYSCVDLGGVVGPS